MATDPVTIIAPEWEGVRVPRHYGEPTLATLWTLEGLAEVRRTSLNVEKMQQDWRESERRRLDESRKASEKASIWGSLRGLFQ